MIFLGDIAYPGTTKLLKNDIKSVFKSQPIIFNLEGPTIKNENEYTDRQILFNSYRLLDEFSEINKKVANLANNHIMDLGLEGLLQTEEELSERDIPYVGAGRSIGEASGSTNIVIDDKKFIFLSFGWEVIECSTATENKAGVNPLKKKHVLKSVAKARKEYSNSPLIVQFHWNYELERYPQPRHRDLAKKVIDLGASLVVGHHPHVVNGIEIYKEHPIVYSLGNWFIPHNYFWDGELKYSEGTLEQLAFEWDGTISESKCHWFSFDPKKNEINFKETNALQEDTNIKKLTPFAGMKSNEYEEWFRENRVKRKGLPIYSWDDGKMEIGLKNSWVNARGKFINALLKLGLK